MRRLILAAALAAVLAGCSQEKSGDVGSSGGAPAFDAAGIVTEEAAMGRADMAPPASPPPPPAPVDALQQNGGEAAAPNPQGPAPVLFLAYSYSMGMQLPADRLIGVMEAHVRACQEAGPRLCQLIGSNRSGDPESYMNGYVSLRGEPVWLNTFMNGVAAQADEAGGRVTQRATNSEDLTRAIVDTEARLRAMTTLRDRLQRLLDSRPGRLSDLLEVERELARVQGELDAVTSSLAVMRTRVSMSELSLSYESAPQSLRADTFEPLKTSIAGFVGNVVGGIAAIITVIAVLLPWAALIGLVGWLALKWRRARGGRFFVRKPKADAEPPAAS